MTTERKLFTAEIKRLQARGEAAPSTSNSEVLKAINDLRADLRGLEALVRGEAPVPPPTSCPRRRRRSPC